MAARTKVSGEKPELITVAIIEDNRLVREGMTDMLNELPDVKVVLALTTLETEMLKDSFCRPRPYYQGGRRLLLGNEHRPDGNLDSGWRRRPECDLCVQAGSTFVTAGNIVLINGAQARNVYFQVGSSATLGTGSVIQGNILAQASITINDNVTLNGRALARTGAVTLGTGDTINLP